METILLAVIFILAALGGIFTYHFTLRHERLKKDGLVEEIARLKTVVSGANVTIIEREAFCQRQDAIIVTLKAEKAKAQGGADLMVAYVAKTEERLQQVMAGHAWSIEGSATAHSGQKLILYGCNCGTRILVPEGFVQPGHEVSRLQAEETLIPKRGREWS